MSSRHLHYELWLPRPIGEVFEFFADARNLQAITPDWLRFSILTPAPIVMREGTLIDYRLRLRGLPLRWRSEITCWDPPVRFVDEQRRGPYRLWRHEHLFAPKDQGTLVTDHVTYRAPGGGLIDRFFVRPDLRRIFDYRHRQLAVIFGQGFKTKT